MMARISIRAVFLNKAYESLLHNHRQYLFLFTEQVLAHKSLITHKRHILERGINDRGDELETQRSLHLPQLALHLAGQPPLKEEKGAQTFRDHLLDMLVVLFLVEMWASRLILLQYGAPALCVVEKVEQLKRLDRETR